MKKTFLTLIAAFITVTISFGAKAMPEIKWLNDTIDFGAFDEDGGNVRGIFKGVNIGDEPYQILRVATSCGCTSAGYSRDAVMPGDTVFISVEYDPTGRPGRFSKKVSVTSNASPARKDFLIKGVVIGSAGTIAQRFPEDFGDLKLRRNAIMLGEITKGRLKSSFIQTYNRGTESVNVKIGRKPKYIDIKTEPNPLPPGQQGAIVAYFRSADCPLYGLVADSVEVIAGDRSRYLLITAIVNEDFSMMSDKEKAKAGSCKIEEPRINLGLLTRSGGNVSTTIKIKNEGKSPLYLRRVYTTAPGVTTGRFPEKIGKGKTAEIPVEINPKEIPGDIFNGKIQIITSDPFEPTQSVRITAEIKN